MISVGNHIDRDADAAGYDQLGTRAMNGFDQSPTEFSGVLEIERDQARRRMALIEGIDRFDEDPFSIRQNNSWLTDLPAGKR